MSLKHEVEVQLLDYPALGLVTRVNNPVNRFRPHSSGSTADTSEDHNYPACLWAVLSFRHLSRSDGELS
ncbi:unnamed protein product [Pleuronectes platessa]|uniref:Uncharacterized protein n=1 Tax=Pleuronectes platessa TaxID=8262 RepID=A0A9N7U0C5_PLEPL|nr:unnamed protein product [Pleuronectes platessa]